MESKDLLWKTIGKALQGDIDDVPMQLLTLATQFNFTQEVIEGIVRWYTKDDVLRIQFFVIPDPRDLDAVLRVYAETKENECLITYIFVHQWTDGEGNWDLFMIHPGRRMEHRSRLWGDRNNVNERGPALRKDIYTLFQCGSEFPEPGSRGWVKLLEGPQEKVDRQLEVFARERDCRQEADGNIVRWLNQEGQTEALFFLLPDPSDIDAFVTIYKEIKEHLCPVSFVFLKCEEPGLYDIFRLSGRSYLEHHNQAKKR